MRTITLPPRAVIHTSQPTYTTTGIGLSHHIDARRTDVWSDWRSSQHSSLGCWTSRTHLLNTPIPQAPCSCRLNLAGPLIAPVLVIKIHSLVLWRQRP
ncbi:hypothetical protein HBH69_225630 [Parastagonospora nodorum]|nr:hypothetical protein HBH69_225630 [Parastagonospora nodorum]KAH5526966.1 hypothetical protein HBI27_239850 [Parastagonospora nodorum]